MTQRAGWRLDAFRSVVVPSRRRRQSRVGASLCGAILILLLSGAGHSGGVFAQAAPPAGVLDDGDAVVTGFSGTQPPILIAPGTDPADKTYIDLAGPSARVVDLPAPGAPPQAQLWPAPKPFTVTARQVGQVFAVALDNASPPNIYLAATSAYGLPIVVPDKDGDGLPDRVKQGAPNASFMPGLFGPSDQGGGPGSIWRIDGVTGEVRLFANVTLDGAPNSGPALGGLAFDPVSNSLFVADRETGMIHRLDMSGTDQGHYDHGSQGRSAAGLPPVPFNAADRLDITKPQFHTDNPATWGYAPPSRRIFGLAVRAGRLYYAVGESLQIWSIAIAPDGTFGADARIEITVPPNVAPTEISKITFDDQGRMLLAERAASTGAYDFAALAQEGIGRVLRYAPVAGAAPGASAWQSVPDQYAIGFPLQMRNANGGVAVGYGYDEQGRINRASCGGFLWSTGEELRVSADPALAAQLAQGGQAIVNGLQGNDINLVVPANVPPLKTYFIDYDDEFDDPEARGQLGDIAIWRSCGRAGIGGWPWLFGRLGAPGVPGGPGVPPPPPFCPVPTGPCICPPGGSCSCPPGTAQQPGFQCCPMLQMPGPGGCQSLCANGAADLLSSGQCWYGFQPFDPATTPPAAAICWDGSAPVNHGGAGGFDGWQCPMPPNAQCPAGFTMVPGADPSGYWSSGGDCVVTPQQVICGAAPPWGQVGLDGQCHDLCPAPNSLAWPIQQCCAVGTVPDAFGHCTTCPTGQMTANGICCPAGQQPGGPGNTQCVCPPAGLPPDPVTGACPVVLPLMGPAPKLCPDGKLQDPSGKCPLPPPPPPPPPPVDPNACFSGYSKLSSTQCCLSSQVAGDQCCPLGQTPDEEHRTCVPISTPEPKCVRGYTLLKSGCCRNSQVAGDQCCPLGQTPDAEHRTCVAFTPTQPSCSRGYTLLKSGCCRNRQVAGDQCCPAGQTPDAEHRSCVPISGGAVTPIPVIPLRPICRPGSILLQSGCCPRGQVNASGQCCPPGQRPVGRTCATIAPVQPLCPGGLKPDAYGKCPPLRRVCKPGQRWDGSKCVPILHVCPPGKYWDGKQCVGIRHVCPPGQHWDGKQCVRIRRVCPPGKHWDGKQCVFTKRVPPPKLLLQTPAFKQKGPD